MDFGFSTNSQAQPVEQPQSKMPNNTILSTYREQIRMAMMNYAKACSLLNTNNSVVGIVNGCLADFEKKIKDKVDGGSSSSSGLGFLGMGGMRKRRRSTSSKKKTSTKKKSSSKKNKKFLGIRLKNIGLAGGAKSKRKSSTKKRTSRKKKSVKKNAEFLGIKLKNIGLSGGKSKRKSSTKKISKKRLVKKPIKNMKKRTSKKRTSSNKSKKSNFFGLNLKSIGL